MHLVLQQEWMVWPWRIRTVADFRRYVYVFVDDFLGTGRQFHNFAADFSLSSLFSEAYCIYAPLVAHASGLESLNSGYPSLRVTPVELLDTSHNLFSTESYYFRDTANTAATARSFYAQLVAQHGLPATAGFGDLGLVYAFEHATPDNSLPILWAESSSWHPLCDR